MNSISAPNWRDSDISKRGNKEKAKMEKKRVGNACFGCTASCKAKKKGVSEMSKNKMRPLHSITIQPYTSQQIGPVKQRIPACDKRNWGQLKCECVCEIYYQRHLAGRPNLLHLGNAFPHTPQILHPLFFIADLRFIIFAYELPPETKLSYISWNWAQTILCSTDDRLELSKCRLRVQALEGLDHGSCIVEIES